jgi:hypothetical protein
MSRVRPRLQAFLLLTCLFTALLVVASDGAARALPIDKAKPGKVVEKVNDGAGKVVEKVNDGAGGLHQDVKEALHETRDAVVGAVDQASRAADEDVSRVVADVSRAAPGPTSPEGSGDGGEPWVSGRGDRQAEGITESAPPRVAGGEGDVDELAEGGNEILPGAQGNQQGVGITSPLGPPGGENRPLGFTGLNLLMAMALSIALASVGSLLLEADRRRLAPVALG